MSDRLKTVRVNATMHSFLVLDINVPKDMSLAELWEKIKADGAIDGGDMEDTGFGDWSWDEIYEQDFDPEATEMFTDS